MKTHTNDFKSQIKKLGKQLSSKITYTLNSEEIELGNPELNSVTPHYEANILKSVMKKLDIDSNVEIPVGTEINYQFGVLVGNSYEYLDFGNYIVKEVEKQEDTNSWLIKCCDKMLYAMKDYEQMSITYPITVRNYISAICGYLGLTFANATDTFVNYDKEIPQEIYFDNDGNSLGYTFRDVLDDLAEVTASTIVINDDDELEIRYINQTVGKNLFNGVYKKYNYSSGLPYSETTNITINSSNSNNINFTLNANSYIYVLTDTIQLEPNTQYTISFVRTDTGGGGSGSSRNRNYVYSVDNSTYSALANTPINLTGNVTITFTTTSSGKVAFAWGSNNGSNGQVIDIKNIQLEEGNISTSYEPYGDTIDEEYLKDVNVKFGEKYGAVNTVVLSRSAGADKISQSIPADLPDENKISVVISDNLIMNDNDRAEYIPAILTQLNGLEYYLNDFSSTGIAYYDVCDKYNIQIGETTYSCIMFNDEMLVTQGLQENIHTDEPEYEETDYKKTDKTDQKINQTNLIVDKQGRQITQIIQDQNATDSRLNETISTLDGTIQRVSRTETVVTDITTTIQNTTGENSLYIEDALEENALSYSVDGATSQDGTPTPDSPIEVETIPSIINLFDKDNANIINCSMSSSAISNTSQARMIYIPITGGKTYTISKIQSSRFRVATTQTTPAAGVTISNYSSSDDSTAITVNTSSTAKYLCAFIYLSTVDTLTPEEIINTIMIEEGTIAHEYVPYGYWSKVKVTGKNIFDDNIFNYKYSNSNNTLSQITGGVRATFTGTSSSTNRYSTMIIKNSESLLGKTYTLSANIIPSASNTGQIIVCYLGSSGNVLGSAIATKTSDDVTFTFPSTMRNDSIGFGLLFYSNVDGTVAQNDYVDYTNIMLEENDQATTYEPYKENQVLIDMSKTNLFDSSSAEILQLGMSSTTGAISTNTARRLTYISCKPNTTYIVTKRNDGNNNNFIIATSTTIPANGVTTTNIIANSTAKTITITSGANDSCLIIQFYRTDETTLTEQQVLESIIVYEGSNQTPYYELCRIGDYKDTLSIDSSGNCVINKNVGKIVLNGSESWSGGSFQSSYRYKTTINDATTPSANDLNIYSNYFHASSNVLDSNITTGEIAHYKSTKDFYFSTSQTSATNFKTWLSTHNTDVYYPLATPETINLANTKIPLFEGINHVTFVDDLTTNTSILFYRETPLSSTYATQKQLNDVSVEKTQQITQVRNEVLTEVNTTNVKIDVIQETIDETGVPIVTTSTGYTFDSEGLKLEKSDQDVKSLIDNDGLVVSYKTEEKLSVRSNGVNAENMTVRKFYIQKPIRMEKTKSITDGTSVGLGFFYVGE